MDTLNRSDASVLIQELLHFFPLAQILNPKDLKEESGAAINLYI